MAEADILPQNSKRPDIETGDVDLLVALSFALPSPMDNEAITPALTRVKRAVQQLSTHCRTSIALPSIALPCIALPSSGPEQLIQEPSIFQIESAAALIAPENTSNDPLHFCSYQTPSTDISTLPWLTQARITAAIFSVAGKLNARACTVLGADSMKHLEVLTPVQLSLLLEPCMQGNLDLVMPHYAVSAFDDLLNKGILYPLTRALYGRRVRYPLATEFQASSKLLQSMQDRTTKDSTLQSGRLLWLASAAANANLKICQVYLGAKNSPAYGGIQLSDALAQMAGPLFLDMEDNAVAWQRIRGSHEVPTFGSSEAYTGDAKTVAVHPMIEAFQLGTRNLREIWSLILPPATLLELKKLAVQPTDSFRMSDILWARIVYDFALAHRLRNIHRAHLFGALMPLYLGWAASYAMEIDSMGAARAEERVETLAITFETEKAYLVSRWRWPDRFHS